MHNDSLELIRKSSATNGGAQSVRSEKIASKESVEILDGLISAPTKKPSSVIKLDDDGSKVVKMSHIEVSLKFFKWQFTHVY